MDALLLTITATVLALGYGQALRNPRNRQSLITARPYNNRYSDASAARDDLS